MLLVRILKTLVTKFGTLRSYMERVEEAEIQSANEQEQAAMGTKRQLGDLIRTRKVLTASNEKDKDKSSGSAKPPLTPEELNQHALAQVMRRSGPVAHVAGLGLNTGTGGGSAGSSPELDSVRDLKGLIKTMMMGLKTMMW